jgi:NADPH-dependent 2,4-dienoyl-CoA reductase/sulfur reductase-like enzyme
MALTPTPKAKKVLVVGGGPSGLEAARVAALRGHSVTLFEKTDRLGGQYALSAHAPFKQDNAVAMSWLSRQAEKNGVTIELGKEATPEVIEELRPEVVIIASGAVPLLPDIPGINKSNVVTAVDVLAGSSKVSGKVLIVGGGLVGCETADLLCERGMDIVIIEILPEIAVDWPITSKILLLKRLSEYGVTIITSASLKEILNDRVVITKDGKEDVIQGIDYIVLAMGMKSVEDLSTQIKGTGTEIYVIGDAKEPRKIIHAISEGAEIGRRI